MILISVSFYVSFRRGLVQRRLRGTVIFEGKIEQEERPDISDGYRLVWHLCLWNRGARGIHKRQSLHRLDQEGNDALNRIH